MKAGGKAPAKKALKSKAGARAKAIDVQMARRGWGWLPVFLR